MDTPSSTALFCAMSSSLHSTAGESDARFLSRFLHGLAALWRCRVALFACGAISHFEHNPLPGQECATLLLSMTPVRLHYPPFRGVLSQLGTVVVPLGRVKLSREVCQSALASWQLGQAVSQVHGFGPAADLLLTRFRAPEPRCLCAIWQLRPGAGKPAALEEWQLPPE